MDKDVPIWQPSVERIAQANVTAFAARIAAKHAVTLADYTALYRWSIEHPEAFWREVRGYWYNGKPQPILERVATIVASLPTVVRVIVAPYLGAPDASYGDLSADPRTVAWNDFIAPFAAEPIDFEPLPFDHPLCIMYSSGTTGVPKCIVHGAGGTLLQHVKEHRLQSDLKPGDRLFFFTTCGWMMWNWLVSGLAARATLMLFDGAPFVDRGRALWDFAEEERMTHFGTSAKYIDAA